MFVLYVGFIVLMFIVSRVFKSEKPVLVVSSLLVSILTSMTFSRGLLDTIVNFSRFYFSYAFLSIVLVVVASILASELLLRLGLVNFIRSKFNEQISAVLVLLLMPTVKIRPRYRALKMVSFLSITNILVFSMLITLISKFDIFFFYSVVFLNFFVVIELIYSMKDVKLEQIMELESSDELSLIDVNFRFWSLRVFCYLLFVLLLGFISIINPVFLLTLFCLFVLVDLVVVIEIKIYNSNFISEVDVLKKVDSLRFVVIDSLGYLLATTMYVLFVSDWVGVGSFWSTNDATILLVMMLVIGFVFLMFGGSFIFSLALVFPFLAVINWNLISHVSQYTMLFLMISVFGYVSVSRDMRVVKGVILGLLCYVLLLYTHSLLVTYGVVFLFGVISYYMRNKHAKS